MKSYFAIYYVNRVTDKDQAFRRAAETWARTREGYCKMVPVTHACDLLSAFINLAKLARKSKTTYDEGAMFVHSTPSWDTQGHSGGLHFASSSPSTLVGFLRRPDILASQGLEPDTITPSYVKQIERLPWSSAAKFYIYGCRSGIGSTSIAKLFADSQGVTTIGQTGWAYFSKSPYVYEKVTAEDKTIYLKAFYRKASLKEDMAIQAWKVSLAVEFQQGRNVAEIPANLLNQPMPERTFFPAR